MKLRYCLYLLKAPRFPDNKLPDSFRSLPKSFDREVFSKAVEAQEFEEPILIATSEMSEELQSVEATLNKAGCKCLFIDAGSSLKRMFDAMREKSEDARLKRLKQKALVEGARDAKEVANANVMRGLEKHHIIIGAAFAGLLVLLLGVAFGARACSSGSETANAERPESLPGPIRRAEATWMGRLDADGTLAGAAGSTSSHIVFQFYQQGLVAMHPQVFPERVRAYVPGTGPWARWVVRARAGEEAPEALVNRFAAESGESGEARSPFPVVELASLWAVGGVEDPTQPRLALALARKLAECTAGDPDQITVATRGLAARRWSREADCDEAMDACLSTVMEASCEFFLAPVAPGINGTTVVLDAMIATASHCYEDEGLPLTDGIRNNLAAWAARVQRALVAKLTWEEWTTADEEWVVRGEAVGNADCEEMEAWLARQPERQAENILGRPDELEPIWTVTARAETPAPTNEASPTALEEVDEADEASSEDEVPEEEADALPPSGE